MKRCGLLGERLGHSYSPAIHAMLGDYEYRLYECPRDKLGDFLKARDFDGLNVTIPYKKAVLPYCAELSPMAAAIGSVNTLLRRPDGSLYGDNTDAFGFESLHFTGRCGVCGCLRACCAMPGWALQAASAWCWAAAGPAPPSRRCCGSWGRGASPSSPGAGRTTMGTSPATGTRSSS